MKAPIRLPAFLLLNSALAFPQSAVIQGVVTDPDGNRVREAIVEAKNTASGTIARATVSGSGEYTVSVPAGNYDLNAPMPCCQWGVFEQKNIVVRAGETRKIDVHLPWGANLGALGDDPILLENDLRNHAPARTGPAPKLADGTPDLSGIWLNVYNPDTPPPPLKPAAAALFRERSQNNSRDYPGAYCLPANAEPITRAFPYRFVQSPGLLVMLFDQDTPGIRQIFMDGRGHPADWFPTWSGHSIGRWDGETLVIDTVGYNDKSWLSLSGVPHSEKLHTVMRIRRPDFSHIEVEIDMDDADAFTSTWKRNFTATLAPPDTEIGEFICNENNRDVPHYH